MLTCVSMVNSLILTLENFLLLDEIQVGILTVPTDIVFLNHNHSAAFWYGPFLAVITVSPQFICKLMAYAGFLGFSCIGSRFCLENIAGTLLNEV